MFRILGGTREGVPLCTREGCRYAPARGAVMHPQRGAEVGTHKGVRLLLFDDPLKEDLLTYLDAKEIHTCL